MADWPYNTRRWQRLRVQKLMADPMCEYCPADRQRPASQVDHKRSIKDGGDAWAWGNLASSCQSCHSAKTGHRERLHGCNLDGWPRDAQHPWHDHASASHGKGGGGPKSLGVSA